MRWKPNGKAGGASTANDFVKENCHFGRGSPCTLLVARMAPKLVLPTYLTKSCRAGSVRDDPQGQNSSSDPQRLTRKEQCSSIPHPNRPMFHVKETRSRDAANAAAERRWNTALQYRYLATPTAYGEIIGAIDPAMQAAATEAELKRHGAGLAYILDQLKGLR